MPSFQPGLTTAENILLGAAKQHGMSSILLSPLKGLVNLIGKPFGKSNLGSKLVSEGIIAPSEKITRGAKIFDHPIFGLPFKQKVSPEDIASAAQHYDLPAAEVGNLIHKAQYGGLGAKELQKLPGQSKTWFMKQQRGFSPEEIQALGRASADAGELGIHSKNVGDIVKNLEAQGITLRPDQVEQLNKYIDWSKPYAYRFTAPFETVGKAMVLPTMGMLYAQEKLDRHQKEKLYKKYQQLKQRQPVANLSPGYYNRHTMNKGGEAVPGNENEVLMKRADVQNAVETIATLRKTAQAQEEKIEQLEREKLLYKEAANLIGQGLLDPTQMDIWVEQNATEFGDDSVKLAQRSASIPVSSEIGSLAETAGSKGRHHQGGGASALQAFNEFVFGSGSSFPGI